MNRANCEFVDTWLDHWMAGRLSVEARQRFDAHVHDCERCQRLVAIVRGAAAQDGEPESAPDDNDLFDAVLSRTSGNACRQAETLLPALVDGELDKASRDIVSSHLAHCGGCRQVAAALEEARAVLPSLAEVEPPPGFTARVLARTSRARNRSAVAEWWARILLRPRASLELAYVGAILIVVLVGNPVIAFRGAEEHARRLVGSVPVDRIAGELPARQAAVGLVASAVNGLLGQVRAIGVELSNRWLQAKAIVDGAWDSVVRAANWVRTFEWKAWLKGAEQPPTPGNKAPPGKDAR